MKYKHIIDIFFKKNSNTLKKDKKVFGLMRSDLQNWHNHVYRRKAGGLHGHDLSAAQWTVFRFSASTILKWLVAVPETWIDRGSLFSETSDQRKKKSRERFGGTNATGVIIGNFSPFSALKWRKKVERGCVLPRNILCLAGWRESKPCPATKSEKPAFLLRKALGLDRVTPTLQRNREKKPPGNEKKAEF